MIPNLIVAAIVIGAVALNQLWWWRQNAELQGTIDDYEAAGRVTCRLSPAESREIADMLESLRDLISGMGPIDDYQGPFEYHFPEDPDRVAHFRDLFRQHAL